MTIARNAAKARLGSVGDGGKLLKAAMRENALVSAVTAVILMAGAPVLDTRLGVNPWVLGGIGFGLLTYAVDLVWWSRSQKWLRNGGRIAIIADIAWVIGAIALILLTDVLTRSGEAALAAISAVVAAFAAAQWLGLRRLDGNDK